MIGKKLSHYSVTAQLGAGGMGEVYRARDTKLGRDVALKVLPPALASDTERMARFEREAQVLASLNHPHIAAIYGLEEAAGTRCLVLELVEGPTLADRIGQGPVPLEEAVAVAKQIAEALEAAHDRGVVHRDLKPGNVKITPEGAVKVLDFGLAKAFEGQAVEQDVSKSPTLTTPATQHGMILGTAGYMSPEQAKGKAVDRRADIWAFGVVLFEMLVGEQLYQGETVSETLAAVIMSEPNLDRLPPHTPAAIKRLLRRCLDKNPKRRLQAIGEARIALEDFVADPEAGGEPQIGGAAPRPRWQRLLPWGVALAALLALVIFVVLVQRPSQPHQALWVSLLAPEEHSFDSFDFALSPDGRQLAFVAAGSEAKPKLWVRRLDSLTGQPLAGTEGAAEPFWSPDGQHIGFFADGRLKRIPAAGGAVQTLAEASNPRGGAWSPSGVILFTPTTEDPVFSVPAAGGEVRPATQLNAITGSGSRTNRWPVFLADGQHFIFFFARGEGAKAGVYVASLDNPEPKLLVETDYRGLVASGYLLFMRDNNLMAQPFDEKRLQLSGNPVPVVENVMVDARYAMAASVSQEDKLVVLAGRAQTEVLNWVNRAGKRLASLGPEAFWVSRLSPDGRRLATSMRSADAPALDIWVFDLERGTRSRFTFDPADDDDPIWSPDGRTIIFDSAREGNYNLYRKAASGLGQEELLLRDASTKYPTSWSPDGNYIAYDGITEAGNKTDVMILPLGGDRKPFPLVKTQFDEHYAVFSPDGKWVAYQSDESGRVEVYIVSFPQATTRLQASVGGGSGPQWGPKGRELFYLDENDRVTSVTVTPAGNSLQLGTPQLLFETQPGIPSYALVGTPDGRRFMVRERATGSVTSLTLVADWPAALAKP